MKEFTQPQIDGTRQYFEGQEGCRIERASVGDMDIEYWVIPQSMNPKLEDFALRMTMTDPKTEEVSGIFGVSDSVPQELRPYWVAHEVIEFTQIGIDTEGRCAQAEQVVVALLPDDLRDAYIDRRISFFTNLVDFFQQDLDEQQDNYTIADLSEAKASLNYLGTLVQ